MRKRHALVCGASGQTGSYLCEALLARDYEIYALVRRSSVDNLARIRHLVEEDRVRVVQGDLTDTPSLNHALIVSKPEEVYNFAAQSYVAGSFIEPIHTGDVTGLGALRLFDAVRTMTPISDAVRTYQASSSEMFGNQPAPQSETTPFAPRSPYACAKVFAHYCAQVYRMGYGMFIACGIAHNHESERRGEEFVTRKITKAIGAIKAGKQTELRLGRLDAARDWSHAEDIAEAAWLMLQQAEPHDYVLASGVSHTVKEFAEAAFSEAGLDITQYLKEDPMLYRPLEVVELRGDATKARNELGWTPKVDFKTLVKRMVQHDLHETH